MVEELRANPGVTDGGAILTETTSGTSVHDNIRVELSNSDECGDGS
jgi:hypothetical protein